MSNEAVLRRVVLPFHTPSEIERIPSSVWCLAYQAGTKHYCLVLLYEDWRTGDLGADINQLCVMLYICTLGALFRKSMDDTYIYMYPLR